MNSIDRSSASGGVEQSDLVLITGFARRNYWVILLGALIGLLIGVALLLVIPKSYESRAVMIIQPQASDPKASQAAPPTPELVRSQLEILGSGKVLEGVVRKLKLDSDPEFNRDAGESASPQQRLAAAREALSDHIKVDNDGRSYTVTLAVRSRSPAKAERIANVMAQTYIETQRAQKVQIVQSTRRGLDARLDDLRRQTIDAEQQTEAFRQAAHLVTLNSIPEDSESYSATTAASRQIIELSKTTAELTGAASTTSARLAAQRRAIAAGRGDSTPEVLSSSVVSELRNQEADVAKRRAELLARYRPDHPLVQPVESQLRQIRSQIASEIGRIHASVASDAGSRAQALRSAKVAMSGLETQLSGQLTASTRFRQLERDARLKRQVYEDFAEQAQRAAEQAGVQLPDVLLASAATAPIRPASPNRPFVLLLSTLLGLLAGFAVAIGRSIAGSRIVETSRTVTQG